jgi:hypothetical protein
MTRVSSIVKEVTEGLLSDSDAYDADVNPNVHKKLWALMTAGKIKYTDDGYINTKTGDVLGLDYADTSWRKEYSHYEPFDADQLERWLATHTL